LQTKKPAWTQRSKEAKREETRARAKGKTRPRKGKKRQRQRQGERGQEDLVEDEEKEETPAYEVPRGTLAGKESKEGKGDERSPVRMSEVEVRLEERGLSLRCKKKERGEEESPVRRKKEGEASAWLPREEAKDAKKSMSEGALKVQLRRRRKKIQEAEKGPKSSLRVGQVGKAVVTKRAKKRRSSRTSEQRRSERISEEGSVGVLPAGQFHQLESAATDSNLLPCTDNAPGVVSEDDLGVGQIGPVKTVSFDEAQCGVGYGDILNWLDSRVDDFLGRLCKTLTTGRLFPLPSSPYVVNQLFPTHSY
jgi:hypothetical protein